VKMRNYANKNKHGIIHVYFFIRKEIYMSKLYLEYLKKKGEDSDKYYLFKSGLFYIFLDEDAKNISKITPLNITNLNNDIVKCGFPSNSLEKYLNIFSNLGLNVEIVHELKKENDPDVNNKIIRKIKNIKIDTLTPLKALNILNELKEMLDNE